MGILNKLVFILGKLDPHNAEWKQRQLTRLASVTEAAEQIEESASRDRAVADLEKEQARIEEAFQRNELDYGRKLFLIQNCIYGVDIQTIAVQIAKLRCFITLVVDQRRDDHRPNLGIQALPNLETKFIAADSLLGITRPPVPGEDSPGYQPVMRNPRIEEVERRIAEVRRRHFSVTTPSSRRNTEYGTPRCAWNCRLYSPRMGCRAKSVRSWRPGILRPPQAADFFDPEWMFGVTDGFDITIGNPPYVRADSGQEHLVMRRAIEATGDYETLWEKWDLYIPFVERAYKLLKPGGLTTMIVSDAFCHAKYAQKAQTWLLRHSRILRLDFLSQIKVFDAAVRNVTYLIQRAEGQGNRLSGGCTKVSLA